MHRICAFVLTLSLLATGAWAQGALPAGGKAGTAKAQTISSFWVTTASLVLLGAGAFLISTQQSSSDTGIAFSGGNGDTLLSGGSSTATTTTTS